MTTRIHIAEYSGSHGMTDKGFWDDFEKLIAYDGPPDIIACTEVTTMNTGFEEARALGYIPVKHGGKSDESKLFVRKDHDIFAADETFATVQVVKGHRRVRYIIWCGVHINGRRCWFHHTHWVARTTNKGHVDPRQARLYLAHLKTTYAMIRLVRRHGKGNNHSFFTGDLNVDERADNREDRPKLPNTLFRLAGLKTIYDELGLGMAHGQGTHHNVIYDVIGKYVRGGKSEGVKYRIQPRLRSDHRPIHAWYDLG